jgi:PAS domain S-box-containing protein
MDESLSSAPADDEELRALQAISEGTAHATGEEFLRSLVRHLAAAVGARYALVARFTGEMRVRTLAYWFRDRIIDNVEWDLAGTPCEEVVRGRLCHHSSGVSRRFPDDKPMVEWGIESYLGVPLLDAVGKHLGHLAVFDERPMPEEPRKLLIFRIFAARAAAELARIEMERDLKDAERRLRDLYDEAPIAYVQEDLQSRFISANAAAIRILGIAPEQVPGTVGMSFIPDTPEAQRRVKEAFEAIGRGESTGGVVLELRRRDDGRPIWIQWWSKPDPSGEYTRTMFIDITEQVLAEQERNRLQQQNLYLQEELKSVHNFEEIVGRSAALAAVLENVRRVAPTDSTVLITGETGTGKELIARAVHSASRRRDKPLIKINCAALPEGLIESELFGHEKGAFTGAIARRLGRFELAHGGTIFLDEIGELPAEAQAKLLRVLQEREFDRIGGTSPIKVDVRVLAATNRDLLKSVREKTFREDLYYRLSVFPMRLPALRERTDDIPLLVRFMIDKFAARIGRRIESVGRETLDRLAAYAWPGNVRELENVLERAVILSNGPILEIGPDVLSSGPDEPTLASGPVGTAAVGTGTLEENERRQIAAALETTGGVIDGPSGAAKILGLHPNTLRSRMKKLGIRRGREAS